MKPTDKDMPNTKALEKAPERSNGAIQTATPAELLRIAIEQNADLDKLEKLMDLQERHEANQARKAFAVAMTAAQSEMGRVSTDATNPQTRSDYATYGQLDRALRPIYTRHGFSLSFDTADAQDDFVRVLCYVSHNGGHSRTHHADMPTDGKGAKGNAVMTKTHATGAGLSYGMRYLLKMIFNVAVGEDDTDGNGPVEHITEEQLATIREWIETTGTKEAKFLEYMDVYSLATIPANRYQKALSALKAKYQKDVEALGTQQERAK